MRYQIVLLFSLLLGANIAAASTNTPIGVITQFSTGGEFARVRIDNMINAENWSDQ